MDQPSAARYCCASSAPSTPGGPGLVLLVGAHDREHLAERSRTVQQGTGDLVGQRQPADQNGDGQAQQVRHPGEQPGGERGVGGRAEAFGHRLAQPGGGHRRRQLLVAGPGDVGDQHERHPLPDLDGTEQHHRVVHR